VFGYASIPIQLYVGYLFIYISFNLFLLPKGLSLGELAFKAGLQYLGQCKKP